MLKVVLSELKAVGGGGGKGCVVRTESSWRRGGG